MHLSNYIKPCMLNTSDIVFGYTYYMNTNHDRLLIKQIEKLPYRSILYPTSITSFKNRTHF